MLIPIKRVVAKGSGNGELLDLTAKLAGKVLTIMLNDGSELDIELFQEAEDSDMFAITSRRELHADIFKAEGVTTLAIECIEPDEDE